MDAEGGEAQGDVGGGFSEASLARIKLANTHSPEPGSSPLVSAGSPLLGGEEASSGLPVDTSGGGGVSDWQRSESGGDGPSRPRPRSALRRGPDDLRIGPVAAVKFGEDNPFPDSPILPSPTTTSPVSWNTAPIRPQIRNMDSAGPMSPLGGVIPLQANISGLEAPRQIGAARAPRFLTTMTNANEERPERGTSPIIQRRRALHQNSAEKDSSVESGEDFVGDFAVGETERGVPKDRAGDAAVLSESPLFTPLSQSDKEDLLSRVLFHQCAEAFNVIEEGEPGASLFVVVDGACQATVGGRLGLAYPVGSFFGEVAFLEAFKAGKVNPDQNRFATFGLEGEEEVEAVGARHTTVHTVCESIVYEIDATDAARILVPNTEAMQLLEHVATAAVAQ